MRAASFARGADLSFPCPRRLRKVLPRPSQIHLRRLIQHHCTYFRLFVLSSADSGPGELTGSAPVLRLYRLSTLLGGEAANCDASHKGLECAVALLRDGRWRDPLLLRPDREGCSFPISPTAPQKIKSKQEDEKDGRLAPTAPIPPGLEEETRNSSGQQKGSASPSSRNGSKQGSKLDLTPAPLLAKCRPVFRLPLEESLKSRFSRPATRSLQSTLSLLRDPSPKENSSCQELDSLT